MDTLQGPMPQCPVEKQCLKWAQVYLKDCVCSRRDLVSLVLGLLSVLSWGVAEVPQILTNYHEKSTEGVSLLFLMTWVVGDIFNVAGCYLEPATLPTQFYMALLYTITTVVLVGQTVYYDFVYRWIHPKVIPEVEKEDVEVQKPLSIPEGADETSDSTAVSTTIRVPRQPTPSRDLYFTSARSLVSSYTPTPGSYSLVGSRGASGSHGGSYLLPRDTSRPPSMPINIGSAPTRTVSIPVRSQSSGVLRVVGSSGALLIGSVGIHSQISRSMARMGYGTGLNSDFTGEGEGISTTGEVFGWIMAAIYMGGRLPQIWLNMKRGTVEGLNPLMFGFALMGNATYVASILVRSTEWAQLKPNMPWLVDAGVCVLLDFFILCQFGYYYMKKLREVDDSEGAYEALK